MRYSSRTSSSAQPAEKFHIPPGARFEPPPIRTVADDSQRCTDALARLHRQLDSLVRNEGRHDQKVRARGDVGRLEEDRVNRWIHDRRLAIIVSADPRRNVRRVGDEPIDARRSRRIPSRQPRHHRPIHPPVREAAHASRTEVGVELIPRIPHRRVAVADVPRPARRDDGLRGTVAGADDQLVRIQVELLDRQRKQREVLAVVGRRQRQPLNERRRDAVALDRRRHRAADVAQREDVGVGMQLAQRFEHALAAAHARQPVVNERRPQLRPPTS